MSGVDDSGVNAFDGWIQRGNQLHEVSNKVWTDHPVRVFEVRLGHVKKGG